MPNVVCMSRSVFSCGGEQTRCTKVDRGRQEVSRVRVVSHVYQCNLGDAAGNKMTLEQGCN